MATSKAAALQKKRRKDFIPYFLGFVIFLYCTVHLVSFTAQETHPGRVRRALGKKIIYVDHVSFIVYFVDYFVKKNHTIGHYRLFIIIILICFINPICNIATMAH